VGDHVGIPGVVLILPFFHSNSVKFSPVEATVSIPEIVQASNRSVSRGLRSDPCLAVSEQVVEQGRGDPGEGLTKHEVMVHIFYFLNCIRTVFVEIGKLWEI
jgi:hypothetical protein